MDYQFASNVCGIPCIIKVNHYFKHGGCYEEIEYSVLDRKGYPAAWLERKLTPKEHARITEEIADMLREEYEAYVAYERHEAYEAMMGDY